MLRPLILTFPLFLLLPIARGQVLVDSIPYPGQGTGVWGIHVTTDTIFLGSDLTGNIRFSDHNGVILGELTTPFNFNHGLIRRPTSYLIAEDYTTNGAGLYEIDLAGDLLGSWTFPNVIGGPSSGIGDLEADGNAVWYTMYFPDFNTYPFAYAYKWVPGDPAPMDTVPLQGEQPYGIALKGDTLLYVTDNLNGDQERIYAYDLSNEQDLGWIELPDTPIDNDQRPQGMHYDGGFLHLVANRQGGSAFAYQTIFTYAFDLNTAIFAREEAKEVRVHPSPASDAVTLHLTAGAAQPYTVFDAHGKPVATGTLNKDRSTVNVADWAPGTYTVKVGTSAARFQVMR
ncbi:MAG: T9SS type A sorting domain-containing protein [Flavobacteriales bacterium]|nr:T9SS type A sorting domain-containing protein [Flavobacteriales bacterium]